MGEQRLPVLPRARGHIICAAGKGPGLIRQDVQQTTGSCGEVARLGADRAQARQQQAEGIVERVIHRPRAGCSSGQGSKALCLLFEVEQGGLVEG